VRKDNNVILDREMSFERMNGEYAIGRVDTSGMPGTLVTSIGIADEGIASGEAQVVLCLSPGRGQDWK
jgi:hypothetical protein